MGLVGRWARWAALAPRVVNLLTATPGLSALLKFAGGIAHERSIPKFARRTFQQWFLRRNPHCRRAPDARVILWADTFNNHFHPGTRGRGN